MYKPFDQILYFYDSGLWIYLHVCKMTHIQGYSWSSCKTTSEMILKSTNRYFREGDGTPLQYSCLENPMGRGAWRAAVHGVAEGQTRLSNFTFTFHSHALEKETATHSSILAWEIPWTEEPGRLQSMGSQRVGCDWSDLPHFKYISKMGFCLSHLGK